MNCGQALVRLLEAYGIDTAFGIPGVHNIELYRGLASSGMRHVLPRHEQGAGFMADGYARVTGRPAACFVISGPGLLNAATPIAQAYSDSQPMVVVATTNTRREIGKGWGPFHELRNQRLIAEQFCGYAGTALAPEDVPELVAQAMAMLHSGRPRPVYIEIPRDVLGEPAGGEWHVRPPARRPAPAVVDIEAAAALLATASRPVILVGAGAMEASVALTRIAGRTGAIVISSFCGKGVIDEGHPNVLGAALSVPEARTLVTDADVVLAIGTELSTADASNRTLEFGGKLIRVDVDARKLTDRYAADVPILADAALAAEALGAALDSATGAAPRVPRGETGAGTLAPGWSDRLARARRAFEDFGPPGTAERRRVLDALRTALPDDSVVVGDMTQLAYTGNHHFRVALPRSWLHPASFATLGYALPSAIGAKLGAPERPVVSLSGDYGFQFTAAEMATAAELKLPIVQIVWNNASLGEIRDAMVGACMEPVEVEAANPDFLKLADACQWRSACVDSLAELRERVEEGIVAAGPTLIEVRGGQSDRALRN